MKPRTKLGFITSTKDSFFRVSSLPSPAKPSAGAPATGGEKKSTETDSPTFLLKTCHFFPLWQILHLGDVPASQPQLSTVDFFLDISLSFSLSLLYIHFSKLILLHSRNTPNYIPFSYEPVAIRLCCSSWCFNGNEILPKALWLTDWSQRAKGHPGTNQERSFDWPPPNCISGYLLFQNPSPCISRCSWKWCHQRMTPSDQLMS